MECSTKAQEMVLPAMDETTEKLADMDWDQVATQFNIDLEATAREKKAMQRVRNVTRAVDLLRIVLFYATSDWSLRLVGAWAELQDLASLSDVAVLKRLCKAKDWIGHLIVLILQRRCADLQAMPGVRIRLLDATVISLLGSKGTDWRTHLSFDLGNLCFDGIELTDAHGGETLVRFPARPNEIWIADRGYATLRGFAALLLACAYFIVRINWLNMPLKMANGQRFNLIAWIKTLSEPAEQTVYLDTPQGRTPVRLVACPIPEEAKAKAQAQAQKRNQKKGRKVSPNTLIAAGFVLLVTNLPGEVWTPSIIGQMYRIRWQIELAIKRLKSILHFDHIRGKHPQLVQTYLLAKLLGALVLDEMLYQTEQQVPEWFESVERPVSVWRLMTYCWDSFCQIVRGSISKEKFLDKLPRLARYFRDSPRKRIQQLAVGRATATEAAFLAPFFSC